MSIALYTCMHYFSTNVRLCVEPTHWNQSEVDKLKDACNMLTNFESSSLLTCGPCLFTGAHSEKVVLLSGAKQDNQEYENDMAIKKRIGHLNMIIHVGDEFNALGVHSQQEISSWHRKLNLLYEGVEVVFRTYPPAGPPPINTELVIMQPPSPPLLFSQSHPSTYFRNASRCHNV
jgi:hypothetical protein